MTPTHLTPRRSSNGGFSMAEILAVLVLIGILTALAAPRFGRVVGLTRLDSSVNSLVADLSLARMQAVRSGRTMTVALNAAGTQYFVIREPAALPADTVKRVLLRDEYAGTLLSPGNRRLTFNSRGVVVTPATETHITATFQGTTRTIRVTRMGRVYRDN